MNDIRLWTEAQLKAELKKRTEARDVDIVRRVLQVHAERKNNLDRSRFAVFLALPTEPRALEPARVRGQGDAAERRGKRGVNLVGLIISVKTSHENQHRFLVVL